MFPIKLVSLLTSLPAARSHLYSAPKLRNAGRSALLRRTLSASPALAHLVLSISLPCTTQQDAGHPSSLLNLLALTRPHSLELGSPLLARHGESSRALLDLLRGRSEQITSWAYGFVAGSTLSITLPLLRAFSNLTTLVLDNVSVGSAPVGDKPRYSLTSATLRRISHLDPSTIDWLLGRPGQLHDLALEQVSLDSTALALNEVLAPHVSSLRWLTVREVDCTRDLPAGVRQRTWDLNALLRSAELLVDLTVGDQLAAVHAPATEEERRALEPLWLPPRLRRLELRGRWMASWLRIDDVLVGVAQRVQKDEGSRLEDLRLVGPFLSDPGLVKLMRDCQPLGVRLEVRRSFQGL